MHYLLNKNLGTVQITAIFKAFNNFYTKYKMFYRIILYTVKLLFAWTCRGLEFVERLVV